MSFRLKTILGIALIESVLLAILVLSSLSFLHDSNEKQLIAHATQTSALFASATKDAVLATDLARLESFVSEILGHAEVRYVRIRNANDQILAEGGTPELLAQVRLPDHQLATADDGLFDVHASIVESGIPFGRVEMGIETQAIYSVFSEAKKWATSIAMTEVALVALFSFVLGTYLTRGLSRLREASRIIEEKGPGHQLEVTGNDEISDLGRAFNTMSASLRKSEQILRESLDNSDQMLTQVQKSRRKNQAILSASLDAIITIDKEGKVTDYNQAAEKILGWSAAEILGQSMADFIIPKKMRDAHLEGMNHYLETGEGPVLGKRIRLTALHKYGHEFPVELAICQIDTTDGPLFTAFLRDISKQAAAETELRLAATAFETNEPMFFTDADARITRTNLAFTRTSGYEEEEVLGKTPRLWASGMHDSAFYEQMWQDLLKHGRWSGEIFNRHKNGEIFPQHLSITAVTDDSGKTTHYVAQLIDISEQKAREKQLRQASQQAKEADEAKGRFLAVMSHEIRTPLNAVLGMLDLLEETRLDEHQLQLIATSRDSGELLLSIINDILDFSKMEAGMLQLENSVMDLHQVLSRSVDLFRALADKKGIELLLDIDENLPRYVTGDRCRLRQILVNLIGNALKFTDVGSVSISACGELTTSNTVRFRCRVKDTGIGIAQSQLDTLFQEFSMIDQSHTRHATGTGLGLAISKQLINLMKGSIEVESQVGEGSSFVFQVDLTVASPDQQPILGKGNGLGDPENVIRVLLAEDNVANQKVFAAMLASTGLELDTVEDGKAAVNAARSRHYDLILMDISMPQMDGLSATREIRKLGGHNLEVPIIAITAHSLSGDRNKFMKAGMNDYLSKPVKKTDLLSRIAFWSKPIAVKPAASLNMNVLKRNIDNEQHHAQPSFIDEAVLQQLVDDTSPDVVPDLLKGYIDDSRTRISVIEHALEGRNPERLEFEAHTLGSSAAAHANPALHKQARKVERLCQSGNDEDAFAETKKLLDIARRSLDAVEQRLEKGLEVTQ